MSYDRPETLDQALEMLAQGGARPLGGGTDLFPATTARALDGVIDLTRIRGLRGIDETQDGWRIGATTRWSDIAHADLPPAFRALQMAAREIGSVQIQNAGTLAGNLCNASPAADGVPPLLVLEAEVELSSRAGRRRIPLGAFLTGPRQTALRPGELLTAVLVPKDAGAGVSSFAKLGARKYLVISIAMAAVRLVTGPGGIAGASVAVGACSPVARRLPGVEAALVAGGDWHAALEGDVARHLSPIDDIRADAAYRREAAVDLAARVIREVLDGV
jgi:CO/xanthine dehydrogenase FAD-binding subunit